MKIVMLDAATLGADVDLSPITALGETDIHQNTAADEVVPRLQGAQVAVLNKIKMTRAVLEALPALRLICVTATGFDNVDTASCAERGVALCNVPAYSTDSVAQMTLAMVLSLATHLPAYRDYVHSGAYSASGLATHLTPVFHELAGKVWGVIGGGNIGGRVARVADAMGASVIVCRRSQDPVFPTVDIDTLCRTADVITVHLPLSPETRGILSRERIASMKQGAIVVNVARGAVTDEQALADAVRSGQLGGLGVDTFSVEPFPAEHPFAEILGLDNVCFTPHVAWGSFESRSRCVRVVGENIARFFAGVPQNKIV